MQKAKWIADHLSQKLSTDAENRYPSITWTAPETGKGEKFKTLHLLGEVKVEAESILAAAYGVSQVCIGMKSGHLSEFLGESQPRYPLRPLWVCGRDPIKLADGIGIALPSCFRENPSTVERWCQRIIQLGFNAVLLGNRESMAKSLFQESDFNLQEICKTFQEYGIQVLLKPALLDYDGHRPLDPSYRRLLQSCLTKFLALLPSIDYLFWESFYLHPFFAKYLNAKDMTIAEAVLDEVKAIEEISSIPLIYYIPVPNFAFAKQQSLWMSKFCDDVGPQTIVAFSAVGGNVCEDHIPPHPFWEHLRQSQDTSATPLLPIVNIGSVMQGEGLWPTFSVDLLENYYNRMYRHRFAGAIALVHILPKEGGLLDCSLWAAAQCLWRTVAPRLLIETWFRAYRLEWDFRFAWEILTSAREIAVELSYLRSLTHEIGRDMTSIEECRTMTESILCQLKDLQRRAEKLERKKSNRNQLPSLSDYLSFFIRDAQRIILYFLQCFNLSYPHLFNEEDLLEGFWTHSLSKSGQGIRSGAKVTFFEEPQRGPIGSKMEAIFLENRLI